MDFFILRILFDDDSLIFDFVAIDEPQHINAGQESCGGNPAVGVFGTEDVSEQVDHLQGSRAVDNDLAIADEGEFVV